MVLDNDSPPPSPANTALKVALATQIPGLEVEAKNFWTRSTIGSRERVPTVVAYSRDAAVGDRSHAVGLQADALRGNPRFWVYDLYKNSFPYHDHAPDDDDGSGPRRHSKTLVIETLRHAYNMARDSYEAFAEQPQESRLAATAATRADPPKGWSFAKIDFVLSIPATGDFANVGDQMRQAAVEAGLATHSGHRIVDCHTEPQAVAAFALNRGDSISSGSRLEVRVSPPPPSVPMLLWSVCVSASVR
jgi:hypothetical protein